MMHTSIRQTIIAATALIGLSSFAALAAPPAAAAPPTAPATAKTQPVAGHHMGGNVEQHIADLHTKLKISAAQQPQWDEFAAVMRENAQAMETTFQHRMQVLPTMTAAENMQSYADVAKDHAQEVQKLVPTFVALYNTMSDSQKHNADQVFRTSAAGPHHG